MVYTAEQATDAIADLDLNTLLPEEVEQEVKNIINQLDTTALNTSSTNTVLYSEASVDDIVDNPNYRLIKNTEAYKFLNHDSLQDNEPLNDALEKAYGDRPDFDQWTSQAGKFIGGDDSITPRIRGAWDTVSANFVQGAEGNVITKIGDNASINSIFFQTELESVGANPNITHIDGIEKTKLLIN